MANLILLIGVKEDKLPFSENIYLFSTFTIKQVSIHLISEHQ